MYVYWGVGGGGDVVINSKLLTYWLFAQYDKFSKSTHAPHKQLLVTVGSQ